MTTRASDPMASSATGGKRLRRPARRGGDQPGAHRLGVHWLGAHWVATLVMMMSVATCITPVIPAVYRNRLISRAMTARSGVVLRISTRTAMLAD